MAEVLRAKFGAECHRRKGFSWLTIDGKPIFAAAYFGPPLHCLFEFDPPNRFHSARLHTLEQYPSDAPLGFDFRLYRALCEANRTKPEARSRRQAAEDAAIDLLPPIHDMNPTLRLAETEVRERIIGKLTEAQLRGALQELLEERVGFHAGTTFLQLMEHPSGKPFITRLGSPSRNPK